MDSLKEQVDNGIEDNHENKMNFLRELYQAYPNSPVLYDFALKVDVRTIQSGDSYYDVAIAIWKKAVFNHGYREWQEQRRVTPYWGDERDLKWIR
jgi:hypothetical protein